MKILEVFADLNSNGIFTEMDRANVKTTIKRVYEIYKQEGMIEVIYRTISKIRRQIRSQGGTGLFQIPEVTPLRPEKSNLPNARLNLLIPSLEKAHSFGGIATALQLFEYIGRHYEYHRIVVTDHKVDDIDGGRWTNYKVSPDRAGNLRRHILPLGDRQNKRLEVGESDHFMATAWWTAYILEPVLEWQASTYGIDPFFYYLIQDYEPGFYPWSSRYAMADSTYNSRFRTKAIVNTKILYDFFIDKGYSFYQQVFIEPPLNEVLALGAVSAARRTRERPYKILVYGRPSVYRNCFEICVEGIEKFVRTYENVDGWEFYTAGEKHNDISFRKGHRLISLGKLSLNQYKEMLSTSSVGLSLMVSPHPSYPPIEMALYGLEVITNTYANKNLSDSFSNVYSLNKLNSDETVELLMQACRKVEARGGAPAELTQSCRLISSWQEAFLPVMRLTEME